VTLVPPRRVVLGLGSNLGDRAATILSATHAVRALPGVFDVRLSPLYETTPVGGPPQPDYLNAAVAFHSTLDPRCLLTAALQIEHAHGRIRRERFGPRILDVDILWIDGVTVDEPSLVVPHARLHERAFALVPLLDLEPDAVDPRTGALLAEWLRVVGTDGVWRLPRSGRLPAHDGAAASNA